jgi:hypothetical protein
VALLIPPSTLVISMGEVIDLLTMLSGNVLSTLNSQSNNNAEQGDIVARAIVMEK